MITCNHLLLGGGKINKIKKVGKAFLSQLLCIATIFGMSSCNDDEVINQSSTAPLQVSVNAQGTHSSRAIIHGEYLPDGSSIGVSLTNEDGGLYDNTEFFNLQYTASGESNAQTWSSDEYASLSTTIGKVTAYYPYNPDITDWTKIPVETASQTDYMYAKPVTGLNIVSSTANLLMQHALTDIRVCIQKGSYTGTGAVTKITAKAPAFATGATMSAEDGTFTSVTGGGTQFETELTDAAISAADVTHDFLVVPLASSTSGEVTIFVTIDDKKFTVNVPYTEAFQQGYSYVYNLTLDNEALTFKGVKVDEWGIKAEYDDKLQFYDDQYIVEIQVPSDNYRFYHNLSHFTGVVDWGDGTTTDYPANPYGNSVYHTYATAGNYRIIAEGKASGLGETSSKIISKIIHIGKEIGLTWITSAFRGQKLLTEIIPGAVDGCTKVTTFKEAFSRCTGLKELPEGLFDKCTEVTDFSWAFNGCTGLQAIPEGLFNNCTKVTDFSYAFYGCTNLQLIPEGLFDDCTEVYRFYETFKGCSSLQTIPEGLFDKCSKVKDFYGTFANTRITKIPNGLFDNCTKVTDFTGTFSGTDITNIPKGLFDSCTEVTSFSGTFSGTDITNIPKGLFDKCTKVTSFGMVSYYEYGCFENCVNLQAIPEGLFDKCTEVTRLPRIFKGCTNISNIPSGLFDYCTEVTDIGGAFASTGITEIPKDLFKYNTKITNVCSGWSYTETLFYNCSELISIPEGLFDSCTEITSFSYVFYGCESLQSIPEGLFDYNTKVTDFTGTFNKCYKLKSIPKGLFDNNTEVTSFSGTFSGTDITNIPKGLFKNNTKVTSFYDTFSSTSIITIPEGLFDHCTEVTTFEGIFGFCPNLKSIPTGLFDYNTNVTRFSYVFAECDALTSIPSGLFDKCTKVEYFGAAFRECKKLTGESPYTIINIDGVDTKVHLYERQNYPEYFTAPTSYSSCFNRCTGLTDYNSIPTSWL